MIYTDLESLAHAATQIDLNDPTQTRRLCNLMRVYWEAYQEQLNIPYAEDALISAQLTSEE